MLNQSRFRHSYGWSLCNFITLIILRNKKVGKPYNVADARHFDYPLSGEGCSYGGRRWYCWVGRWYFPSSCQYKPPLYLTPFGRNLQCTFWLGAWTPRCWGEGIVVGVGDNNITVFIQRLTYRRLVYNGIAQVWEVLEWRQPAANRKVQPAGSLQPIPPLWFTYPSRSWSQLCCLVGRGTCVWTTYRRLLRGMPRPGIELATFRSRVASANHWATAPH